MVGRATLRLFRQYWWILLGVFTVPVVVYGLVAWAWLQLFSPSVSALAFGGGLVVGLSLGGVALLLADLGITKRLTGAEAERWSSSQLHKLSSRWRIINDVPTDFGNIDHVVVGPGVVLAVETKVMDDSPWLEDSLERASSQVTRGAERLRLILRTMGVEDVTVVPCVLRWGVGVGSTEAVTHRGRVRVLSAARDAEWRARLERAYPGNRPSQPAVAAIEKYADPRRHYAGRLSLQRD